MISFEDLSDESAAIYRAHVVARGPARLQELARVMKSSVGPIDAMDGSPNSLVPLWRWWVQYGRDGFKGTELGIDSRIRAVSAPTELVEFGVFAAPRSFEMVQHYVFEVLHRANPTIRWDYPKRQKRVQDVWLNETGIRLSNGLIVNFANELAVFGSGAIDGSLNAQGERFDNDNYLLNKVLKYEPKLTTSADAGPDASILAHLVDTPTIMWDDPMKVTPLETEAEARGTVAAPLPTRAGEDTLLVGRGADFDELPTAPPLDETIVAQALNELGFRTTDGVSVDPTALAVGTKYFELPDSAASIDSEAHGGRLRSLILGPIALTESEWADLRAALEQLATTLGGELRGELRGEGDF